jgi:hypothetical protein
MGANRKYGIYPGKIANIFPYAKSAQFGELSYEEARGITLFTQAESSFKHRGQSGFLEEEDFIIRIFEELISDSISRYAAALLPVLLPRRNSPCLPQRLHL